MSCSLKDKVDAMEAARLSYIEETTKQAEELCKKLTEDCQCVEIPCTVIVKNWKNFWYGGKYVASKTNIKFELCCQWGTYINSVRCIVGDMKIKIRCHDKKYNLCKFFGTDKYVSYEEVLQELSEKVHEYIRDFKPGKDYTYV